MMTYNRFFNQEKNRIEYLFCNFDFYDGIDYLAKIFSEKYGFSVVDEIDGIWFRIIRMSLNDRMYELLWHEDTGNSMYCLEHADTVDEFLEKRISEVVAFINKRIID